MTNVLKEAIKEYVEQDMVRIINESDDVFEVSDEFKLFMSNLIESMINK